MLNISVYYGIANGQTKKKPDIQAYKIKNMMNHIKRQL